MRTQLVGHSLGGLTVAPVGEAIPDRLKAVVFLTAFMLPNGMVAGEMIGHEVQAAAHVPPLFMADPEAVGALLLRPGRSGRHSGLDRRLRA